MIIALIIAILIGGGTYMIMQRGMVRLIVGITLLSHGVNLLILAAGIGAWRYEPLMNRSTPDQAADPLPQAFVLTAIVISMASTAVMLVLAAVGRDDDTRSSDTPERSAHKLRALQTLGREAQHIAPDSLRAARRTQRDNAAHGGAQHHQKHQVQKQKGDAR
ncbi:cation:proton antiporter subunit C [Corynebacterium anserum]|uniref:Cation:proton antiporter n=1 Tax=Corynebacterium anserum TaxID=2684406 RepID=A0A7G7YQF0_9CORY|nr:cation:proton antiporter subunit C [Corynebacterium anserum]MBC2682406.1 cation:proton antiporter [Corynebacterium anserum]QNH96720.1 cation:proton antiporter [Corynebacterium anserum]